MPLKSLAAPITIGALARLLCLSKLGVRLLEKKGIIPKADLRGRVGARLYSPVMVTRIRQLVEARRVAKKPSKDQR